jgi:hypothetical protein
MQDEGRVLLSYIEVTMNTQAPIQRGSALVEYFCLLTCLILIVTGSLSAFSNQFGGTITDASALLGGGTQRDNNEPPPQFCDPEVQDC